MHQLVMLQRVDHTNEVETTVAEVEQTTLAVLAALLPENEFVRNSNKRLSVFVALLV
jgi:hypothetical protein